MDSPQLEMLLKCHDIMQRRYTPGMAMAALVQWIAYQLSIPGIYGYATPTVTFDMYDDLQAALDLELLRRDPWDWLGELALALKLDDWVPYEASRDEAREFARAALAGERKPFDVIFDPLAGTGRLFFALMDLGVDCLLAGTEPLRKPYRILVVNKYLYDMPVYVLNTCHDAPFSSESWLDANRYLPMRICGYQRQQS